MMFFHENEKKSKKLDFDFKPKINKNSLKLAKLFENRLKLQNEDE